MNIYIKIEIKSREFLSRLVLGSYAALKYHDVYLGDDELLTLVEKKILKPGIILEKSITHKPSRIKQLKNYKKNKCKVTSIDEEGGLASLNYEEFAKRRFSQTTLKFTDKVFCWGHYDTKINKKLFKLHKDKFINTGNPRFDLLKTKFQDLVEKRKNVRKKVIILSSFGTIVTNLRLSDNFNLRSNQGQFNSNYSKKIYLEYMNFKTNIFFKFLELIFYLEQNLKKKIEIWMHPKENYYLWKNFVKDKKINILKSSQRINSKNNIYIHNGSISGLEKAFQGHKVISFQPIKSKFNSTAPNKCSLKISKLEGVINEINQSTSQNFFENHEDIKRFISNLNDDSFGKIINEWEKLDNKNLSDVNNLSSIIFKNKIRMMRQNLKYKIYNKKFPPFYQNEISKIHTKLVKIDKVFKNIQIKLIGPKLLKIYKV